MFERFWRAWLLDPNADPSVGGGAPDDGSDTGDGAGGAGGGNQPGEGAGASDEVRLSKKDHEEMLQRVEEARRLQGQLEQAKRFETAALALVRGGLEGEQLAESVRVVLGAAGHSEADIQAYLDQMAEDPDEEGEDNVDPNKSKKPTTQDPTKTGTGGGLTEKQLEDMEKRLKAAEDATQEAELRRIQGLLKNQIQSTLKEHPEVKKFIEDSKALNPRRSEKQAAAQLAALEKDIGVEMVSLLRQKRQTHGAAWNDDWVLDAAKEAGKNVAEKFRSGIGGEFNLGPAPETDAGRLHAMLQKKAPVQAPKYEKGVEIGDLETKMNSFAEDILLREAAGSSGEQTKA